MNIQYKNFIIVLKLCSVWGLGNVFLHCLWPIAFVFINLNPVYLLFFIISLNVKFFSLFK